MVEVIEPWTVFKCCKCDKEYHLQDGAICECGKDESDKLFKLHLGVQNGFEKA